MIEPVGGFQQDIIRSGSLRLSHLEFELSEKLLGVEEYMGKKVLLTLSNLGSLAPTFVASGVPVMPCCINPSTGAITAMECCHELLKMICCLHVPGHF